MASDDAATAALVAAALEWFGTAVLTVHAIAFAWRSLTVLSIFIPLWGGFDFKGCGAWAVVTGSTDGIGLEYAEQLAAKGLNIVLISRSQSKLADVAASISDRYKVSAKTIVADFTCGGLQMYSDIERQLSTLDVGILVNNVGIPGPVGRFLQVPDRELVHPGMLNCNVLSTVQMTSIVMPRMLAKARGLVVNVSSLVSQGSYIMPFSIYPATKSFMSSLARSLSGEFAAQGVFVQNVMPGLVLTKPAEKLGLGRLVRATGPSPRTYVRSALATVGASSDTCGYFPHQISAEVMCSLPSWLWSAAMDLLGVSS